MNNTTTKPMAMLLQDPSVADLYTDHAFPLETDYLVGMSSSKLTLRDADLYDMPLYQGMDWANADLSYATLNKKGDFIDNPQFHQVNAFAVASHTVGLVETAIGREIRWRNHAPLVIRPHAFAEANAFYDPMNASLNFGSFTSPFRRAPIWMCLSHDVVAHEMGHAVLDAFRPQFLYSQEVDTGALHESVGDLMSMFAALEHPAVVERLYRDSGGDMMKPNLSSELGEEFGIGLWGVSFPFLRSALMGVNYDQAPGEIHDRSTVWTAAIYEIFATLVHEATPASVKDVLKNSPGDRQQPLQMDIMRQTAVQQQPNPQFEDYYQNAENRSGFEAFYAAIALAGRRVGGMMLRALQDVPPTGVTFPALARLLFNADARLFPSDPHPRELAQAVFERRMLWNPDIDLSPPGIGALFEEIPAKSVSALMQAVQQNAEALRIPLEAGARLLSASLSSRVRCLDAAHEQRGNAMQYVREHRLYYTYELLEEACFFTPEGEIAQGMVSVYKGGTLLMDEDWNDVQLATDPELFSSPAVYEEGSATQTAGMQSYRTAKQRFIKTHRQSLRAFRDGLVRPDGTLPSGEPALPFKVVRQSSGAGLLIRQRCHLGEHLRHLAGRGAHFPFKVD